eukprot:9698-Heterococcus_DN1.PRE.2
MQNKTFAPTERSAAIAACTVHRAMMQSLVGDKQHQQLHTSHCSKNEACKQPNTTALHYECSCYGLRLLSVCCRWCVCDSNVLQQYTNDYHCIFNARLALALLGNRPQLVVLNLSSRLACENSAAQGLYAKAIL